MSMPLVDGGLIYSRKQALFVKESRRMGLLSAQTETDMSVLQAYLQVLLAQENISIAEYAVALAQQETNRAEILFQAGKITQSDYAQVVSKQSQNQAALVTATNGKRSAMLQLKQLLELPLDQEMELDCPAMEDSAVLAPLPAFSEICRRALENMPQVKAARFEKESAQLGVKAARSGWLPSVAFNVALAGSYNTLPEPSLADQFKNNLGLSAGVSVSIPIYDRGRTRAAVSKARISLQQTELNIQQAEKHISEYVESCYLDVQNAQAGFNASRDNLAAAQESYRLVSEQFRMGMKNTVEMLTEQEQLVQARQSLARYRYQALVNLLLLNLLQGLPLTMES
ncbi:MAG: TolC family protein [Paludibacteraceae bacterium]|nr:TolC family protein [Paludibacteraceae bacterium]